MEAVRAVGCDESARFDRRMPLRFLALFYHPKITALNYAFSTNYVLFDKNTLV